ncbi:unnamed protein product [Cochlearia groenlandica]
MLMEEKLVINELKQGKELANQLMNNFKNPSSSSSSSSSYKESNKILISQILLSYENAIDILNLDKKTLKRSPQRMNQSNKKRRVLEKKNKVKIHVVRGQEEGTSLDDGYFWRKYGQKDINGSKNPRGYYRCTHRYTRSCLAVKQVQKSDTDPLCYEIKYIESHTCNNITPSTTKHSVSSREDVKSEEFMLTLEDLDNKNDIFMPWKMPMENLSPSSSESGITNELLSNSTTCDDSCFSSLENIVVLTHDLSWL